MAITVPQSPVGGTRSGSGANFARTFGSNVGIGNRLIASIARWQGGAGDGTVADTVDTYTKRISESTAGNQTSAIWDAVASTATARTITMTPPSSTFMAMAIVEAAGIISVGSTSHEAGSAGTTVGPGSITTSGPSIIVATLRLSGARTITPAGGWTQMYEDEAGTNVTNSHIYQINSGAGTFTPQWTLSAGDSGHTCVAVAYEGSNVTLVSFRRLLVSP